MFEATLFGGNEFKFSLFGNEYLLKGGKVVEIPKATTRQAGVGNPSTNKEGYYSNLKNENPWLFNNLAKEALLHEQAARLMLEYQTAEGKQKQETREHLALVLGELFDISMANQAAQIKQIEKEVKTAKQQMEFRQKNKSIIVENRLDELLGE